MFMTVFIPNRSSSGSSSIGLSAAHGVEWGPKLKKEKEILNLKQVLRSELAVGPKTKT